MNLKRVLGFWVVENILKLGFEREDEEEAEAEAEADEGRSCIILVFN